MKKKFLAGLALLLGCVPFISVNAATRTAGDSVNYFKNDADVSLYNSREDGWDEVGLIGYYIQADTDSTYSKVISSYTMGQTSLTTAPGDDIMTSDDAVFKDLVDAIRLEVTTPYGKADSDGKVIVDLATKDDVKAIFGTDSGSITLTDTTKHILKQLTGQATHATSYLFTKTDGDSLQYVVIKVTASNGEVTAAEVTEQDADYANSGEFSYLMPVLYMNETYTCDTSTEAEYACYSCPDSSDTTKTTYIWSKTGSQDSSCTLVTTVSKKSKCVTPAKTGVDNYLVPVAIVLGVSLIVLTVVKRKDAFRAV